MLTLSSIVFSIPVSQWMTAPSCTFTRFPMVTLATSPRTTEANQKLVWSPTETSPTTTEEGARKKPCEGRVKRGFTEGSRGGGGGVGEGVGPTPPSPPPGGGKKRRPGPPRLWTTQVRRGVPASRARRAAMNDRTHSATNAP